jgi:NAD(P)-dependent dehydrogenase (short-subunit alcohol dehydrogenase family)
MSRKEAIKTSEPDEKRGPTLSLPKQLENESGLEPKPDPRPKYEAPTYLGSDKLLGKVALITGGDSGIGRAVAVLFAREGADVVITYQPIGQADADETERAVMAEGQRVLLIAGSIVDPSFCRTAVERTVREFGRLDIVVNNASYQHHQENLRDLSDEQWDLTFKTNVYGCFRLTQAALPHLGPGSAIINTGSITGIKGSHHLLDYAATKGAIHAFTKSLARNLVGRGIRVNCVAPGPVWTPPDPSDEDAEDVATIGRDVPMGRPALPEEVAPAFVFFASEADSSYATGEVLTLLGGETTGS